MNESSRTHHISLAGFVITFFGAILFSTKAIIVKKAFFNTQVDALTLLTLRMIFSLPFYLVAAFVISNKEGNIKLTARQWGYLLFLGICGYYLSSLFDFIGLQYISAGLERLILFPHQGVEQVELNTDGIAHAVEMPERPQQQPQPPGR